MTATLTAMLMHLAGLLGGMIGLLGFAGAAVIEHFPVFLGLALAVYLARRWRRKRAEAR